MFFLALLTLLVLSVADAVGEIGTIRIRQRGHRKVRNLIISGGKAFASEWKTIFKYEPDKRAISVSETRFLTVDERGPLGILPEFSSGWLVGKLYRGQRHVSYLRDRDFYVCGDDTIDFIGNCDGALRISLYFEPYSVTNL
ncbi:hypothetical protein OXX59_004012 [Metschnikowia pulcherrima]